MKKKRLVLIPVCAVLLLGLVSVFSVRSARSELGAEPGAVAEAPAPAQAARPVPTALVRPMADDHVRTFPGKVRAARRVDLAFAVAGLLEVFDVREGSRVGRGELIARLDQRDFRHEVDAARAKCTLAERRLDRMGRLLAGAAVTEDDYEDAQTAYEVALSGLRIKEKALADAVLHAPFDGVVVSKALENHEFVEAQQPVMSLQDTSIVEVVIQVPERLLARGGAEGLEKLRVRFDADETRWFEGAVREYNAESDKATRTYDVVVALPPPADMSIYPGMTATVEAHVHGAEDPQGAGRAMLVPVEAVLSAADGQAYVWIIDIEGGAPRRCLVEVVGMTGDGVAVRGEVSPGMRVAVAGLHQLSETAKIRPMKDGKEGLDG